MEATVQITGKKAVKVLGAACLATGVVVLSAVVASGAAVVEGFKSAKNTMQKILKKDEVAEESAFVAMILGTIGGILFALSMCMGLVEEWNAHNEGIIMGVIALVVLLVMVAVWRKMENKEPIKL